MGRAGLAALLLALGAVPARSAGPRAAFLSVLADDCEGAAERLRGLVEELGGRETRRDKGHIVKPVIRAALLVPAARFVEFEAEVRRAWPEAELERETPFNVDQLSRRERRRRRLAAAAEELDRFETQLPVLAAYLQVRAMQARAAPQEDDILVWAAFVEDRVKRGDLLVQAKAYRQSLRGALPFDAAPAPAAAAEPAEAADVAELRRLLDPASPADAERARELLRALDAEAEEFASYLKKRPALSSVLVEARRDLRARLAR